MPSSTPLWAKRSTRSTRRPRRRPRRSPEPLTKGEMIGEEDEEVRLDPHFAERFEPDQDRPACQLYLISPPVIDIGFADQLAQALDAGPVAAFQLRLKGIDEHRIAAAAPPLQR